MTVLLNDYVKEQLCDSLWQGLLATWLPTQQLKQLSNDVIYEVLKFGLHMIRNMPIVSNKYYSGVMCLWTRFILIILLEQCTRELSAMDLWLCALCEVI